jgi:hypothetical protein
MCKADEIHFSYLNVNWYCEIIVNGRVLLFVDFVVHLNHENKKNTTKYIFSTWFLPVMFEVETTIIGTNE